MDRGGTGKQLLPAGVRTGVCVCVCRWGSAGNPAFSMRQVFPVRALLALHFLMSYEPLGTWAFHQRRELGPSRPSRSEGGGSAS